MTCHTAFGRVTGAMASGRRRGSMLSNGLSPATGSDVNGPTAVFRSAAAIDNSNFTSFTLHLISDLTHPSWTGLWEKAGGRFIVIISG